jgi:hypothetical protein
MARKKTLIHDFWHPRVEGQIKDAMNAHPEWFAKTHTTVVRSIAKRIVGEIAAATCGVAAIPNGVASLDCAASVGAGGGSLPNTVASREGGGKPPASLLLPKREWIAVKERLPQMPKGASRPMPVVYKAGSNQRRITYAIFTPKGWIFPAGKFKNFRSERVTHWMPMPKPPRK